MMYTAWTTNDIATTRPLKGVVSYKTGRAGAMAYLKYTSAPPEFFIERRNGGRGKSGIVSRVPLCYIRWTLEFAEK
jgi:hypothetical protein